MKDIVCIVFFLINIFNVSYGAENICNQKIPGFSIVPQSTYFFHSKDGGACFFAYYTKNPNPRVDTKGNGNLGNAVWYAYYLKRNPEKLYFLPKPNKSDLWTLICSIHAISFIDINGDGRRDITIIGSCDKQNFMNLTFPIVFINTGKQYILDEDVYYRLFAIINLSISDIRLYFKDPAKYFSVLQKRNEI